MYRNQTSWSVASLLMFAAVIAAVTFHGHSNRIFSPVKTEVTVDSPEKAYRLWQEKQVKGRILLLFDNYPHARGLRNYENGPVLTDSNLVEFSIFNNIVRKVFLVVRDEEWETFKGQKEMRPLRPVNGEEKALYLYYRSGVPVIAIAQSSLHALGETALIYVNEAVFDIRQVLPMLSGKKIESDILVRLER